MINAENKGSPVTGLAARHTGTSGREALEQAVGVAGEGHLSLGTWLERRDLRDLKGGKEVPRPPGPTKMRKLEKQLYT